MITRRLNVRTLPIPGPDPPVHNATDPFTHQQPQQISSPLFDPNQAYTRNLIATDHDSYTLLLLCWNPGRFSPIHNHPGDGCWMRLLQGQVQECRYQQQSPHQHKQHQQEPSSSLLFSSECARSSSNEAEIHESSNDPLVCIQDQIFNDTDTVVYINDTLGYHKVGNPSLVQPAMSLHLYSPPIATCKVWSTPTSAPVEMTSNPYHTEYGHRRKPILPIE